MSKRVAKAPVSISVDFYRAYKDTMADRVKADSYVDWTPRRINLWDKRIKSLERHLKNEVLPSLTRYF